MRPSIRSLLLPAVAVLPMAHTVVSAQAQLPAAPAASAATQAAPHVDASGDFGGGFGGVYGGAATEDRSAPDNPMLPDVRFDGAPLEEVVEYLRKATPRFQAVVVRDPLVRPGEPFVRLRLKHVPVSQVLGVLQAAYPEVRVTSVMPPPNSTALPVHVIRVRRSEGSHAATAGELPVPALKVYPLGPANSELWNRSPEHPMARQEKERIENALSLIKQVLSKIPEEEGRGTPELLVHEPTQSLIVRGLPVQHAAVRDALDALRPNPEAKTLESLQRDLEAAQARLAKLEGQLAPQGSTGMGMPASRTGPMLGGGIPPSAGAPEASDAQPHAPAPNAPPGGAVPRR